MMRWLLRLLLAALLLVPLGAALAVWLALLSGLLQIVLGFARFGWLLNLVNSPVLMAFTQAAAVLIIASQLPALLGLGGWDSLAWPAHVHLPSLAFGLGSLAALMLARRWRPGFPTVLAVVVASAGISKLTGFEAGGGAVVGTLPQGLPMPYLPGWPGWSVLGQLVLPTLVPIMLWLWLDRRFVEDVLVRGWRDAMAPAASGPGPSN